MEFTIYISPLSVNKAFQGRRFKTKAYKLYEEEFHLLSSQIERNTFTEKDNLAVSIELGLKNDKARDIDNVLKPLCDILKSNRIIYDDRKIIELHVYKKHAKKEYIKIRIEKI